MNRYYVINNSVGNIIIWKGPPIIRYGPRWIPRSFKNVYNIRLRVLNIFLIQSWILKLMQIEYEVVIRVECVHNGKEMTFYIMYKFDNSSSRRLYTCI